MTAKLRLTLALPCLAAFVALAGVARADTIFGSVFNTTSYPAGLSPTAPAPASAIGTFTITNNMINSFAPNSTTNYTVDKFLTSKGATLGTISPSLVGADLNNKEIDFSGNVYLTAGVTYNLFHDDGAILTLNGITVVNSPGPTPSTDSTFTAATGTYSFLLRYAEVNGAPATVNLDTPFSPVPEPATLMMFGTGLLGLGGMVRRRMGF